MSHHGVAAALWAGVCGAQPPILDGRWRLDELLAVEWNPELAQRFPNADHTGCRQDCWHDTVQWRPYDPPRCRDWHCHRCGRATNSMGHHECETRP